MSDDTKLWVVFWLSLTTVVVAIAVLVSAYNMRELDMIKASPDPVATQCAVSGNARNSAFCGAYLARKGE